MTKNRPKKVIRHRDAITGRFVTAAMAKRRPRTTVRETRRSPAKR